MKDIAFFVLLVVCASIGPLAGVLVGAWVYHRGRNGLSPIPAQSKSVAIPPSEDKKPAAEPIRYPKVGA